MFAFQIGLSALAANQTALELLGQNIANAGTPGYHRQVPQLASRAGGSELVGSGVQIAHVGRLRDSLLEAAVGRNASEAGDLSARHGLLRQVEAQLAPGDGSVHDLLEKVFNQFEQLAATPGDLALRRVLLGSATGLANQLNKLQDDLNATSAGLDRQVAGLVERINAIAPQIAELNGTIQQTEINRGNSNDLRDRRDTLLGELSELIDLRVVELGQGQVNVLAAGVPVVLGTTTTKLAFDVDRRNDAVIVRTDKVNGPLNLASGQLAGLLEVRNDVLVDYRDQLDALATALARGLDGVHATGLGLGGPQSSLSGQRRVKDIAVPLAEADLGFPPSAGTLSVSVTELATGRRTVTRLSIDPETQSLQDVAATLSIVPNLQAFADPQTKTLQVVSPSGFAFDFAGRLPSAPDSVAITGNTTPTLGGTYTGSKNDTYTFRVVGTGTVGVTPGLVLEGRDGANNLIASLNVGQGYEPSATLAGPDGLTVRLSAGTANAGDSFTATVTADADTGGLLTALGLNTFFAGENAGNLRVRPDLAANPERLASSRTGQPGDATNLRRLAALRDEPTLAGGTQTYREAYASLVGDVGSRVRDLEQRQGAKEALGRSLEAELQGVSGVDPNEELVQLLQFQRSFQLSARYISIVNESLGDLIRILG